MKRIVVRLIIALAAGFVVAVSSAVAITLIDLYLVGHGRTGLLRESISWPQAGVHMSIGDVSMLGLTLLAVTLGWIVTGRAKRSENPRVIE